MTTERDEFDQAKRQVHTAFNDMSALAIGAGATPERVLAVQNSFFLGSEAMSVVFWRMRSYQQQPDDDDLLDSEGE